jgi:hypothetical protein
MPENRLMYVGIVLITEPAPIPRTLFLSRDRAWVPPVIFPWKTTGRLLQSVRVATKWTRSPVCVPCAPEHSQPQA